MFHLINGEMKRVSGLQILEFRFKSTLFYPIKNPESKNLKSLLSFTMLKEKNVESKSE